MLFRQLGARPSADRSRARCRRGGTFIWISHGHPDHLHPDSLAQMPKDKTILLPDHYHPEIREFRRGTGFQGRGDAVSPMAPDFAARAAMCLDNENQDGILIVEAGDSLVVDLNDSPLCGEAAVHSQAHPPPRPRQDLCRGAVRDRRRHVQFRRCRRPSHDRAAGSPQEGHGLGNRAQARPARRRQFRLLGLAAYLCACRQRLGQSLRVTWADIEKHWTRPNVRKIEPFCRHRSRDRRLSPETSVAELGRRADHRCDRRG